MHKYELNFQLEFLSIEAKLKDQKKLFAQAFEPKIPVLQFGSIINPLFNSFNSLFFGVMKTENFLQIIFVSFLLLSNEPKLITTDFFFLTLNSAL